MLRCDDVHLFISERRRDDFDTANTAAEHYLRVFVLNHECFELIGCQHPQSSLLVRPKYAAVQFDKKALPSDK